MFRNLDSMPEAFYDHQVRDLMNVANGLDKQFRDAICDGRLALTVEWIKPGDGSSDDECKPRLTLTPAALPSPDAAVSDPA